MRPLKSLTLEAMIERRSETFKGIADERAEGRVSYPLPDTLMSGFALMFYQPPSLLGIQRVMKQKRGRCNLETIFGVNDVPSDTQMREILDGGPTEPLRQVLPELFESVRRPRLGQPVQDHGAQRGRSRGLLHDGVRWERLLSLDEDRLSGMPESNGGHRGGALSAHGSGRDVGASSPRTGSCPSTWKKGATAMGRRNRTARSMPGSG